MIIDFKKIIKEKNITPKGVLHIGAHVGQELKDYEEAGFKKIIMIEANPYTFDKLKKIKSNISELFFYNLAISNKKGYTNFHITHNGRGQGEMSSSLLKLKKHTILYPNIKHHKTINVKCNTIDNFIVDNKLKAEDFNMLNMDIQGAELMALEGALQQLKFIDIINTEVNKSELYENCVLLEKLENFLNTNGFYMFEENYKHSPEWGDAIFLRKK